MHPEPTAQDLAAAEGYERLLVPAQLEQWTEVVLDAAGVGEGQRVLDVACGTGVLARHALARVGAAGRVTGVDPAAGMLAVAARTEPGVRWEHGAAEALPVLDGAFDAVVSQFGMMFFDDADRAMSEMLRALGDGGRVAIAVWDDIESNPAYAVEVGVMDRLAGSAAAEALRRPFALGDRDAVVDVLERAGVASVRAETRQGVGRFPDVRTMVEADLYGWLPLMGIDLDEALNQRILDACDRAMSDYVDASGYAVFAISAHIVSGVKPTRAG